MGSGIFLATKWPFLWLIYAAGFVCAMRSLTGKIHGALYLVLFLMPLRNAVEKMYGLPLGKDFIDILFISMIVGSVFAAHKERKPLFQRSSVNTPALTIAIYIYISLWVGYAFLGNYDPFNIADPRLQDYKNFILLPVLFMIILNNVRDKKTIQKVVVVIFLGMLVSRVSIKKIIPVFIKVLLSPA